MPPTPIPIPIPATGDFEVDDNPAEDVVTAREYKRMTPSA
jgi:hypothetical protein